MRGGGPGRGQTGRGSRSVRSRHAALRCGRSRLRGRRDVYGSYGLWRNGSRGQISRRRKRSAAFRRQERSQRSQLHELGRVCDEAFSVARGTGGPAGGKGAGADQRAHLRLTQLKRFSNLSRIILEGGQNAAVCRGELGKSGNTFETHTRVSVGGNPQNSSWRSAQYRSHSGHHLSCSRWIVILTRSLRTCQAIMRLIVKRKVTPWCCWIKTAIRVLRTLRAIQDRQKWRRSEKPDSLDPSADLCFARLGFFLHGPEDQSAYTGHNELSGARP